MIRVLITAADHRDIDTATTRRAALTHAAEEMRNRRIENDAAPQVAARPLYEPSQQAPKHNALLVAIVVFLALCGAVAGILRRFRQPWAVAAVLVIVVAAVVLTGKVG